MLPAGTRYAVLTTEGAPQPDKKTGRMPTEEEQAQVAARHPHHERDAAGEGPGQGRRGQGPGDGMKGPLEEGWQRKVEPSPPW